MRTTLELDRELLERAKEVLRTDSFTEAIETALREAVARAEARAGWEALLGSGRSWNDVEDLLEYRRRYCARPL